MSLSPGTRLGRFEITAVIGSGRLGEVYRAQDTELDRVVAIKVLPEDTAVDAEWLVSLERKVRTLTSLSHPNIGVLHGLEEEDGVRFLVLEFVVGKLLVDSLKLDLLTVPKALNLFIQVAKALEAAHKNRIIHGDLKPANIKLTPEGEIKVLDIGLAESIQTLQSSSSTAVDSDRTTTHVSPEQARGKEADERTDIWAFGCCLYEALTGSAPFGGETDSDRITGILEQDPDWDLLPSGLPDAVGDLLRRCLEKEPGSRFSSVGEMLTLLEEAQEALRQSPEPAASKQKLSVVAMLPIASSVFFLIVGVGSAYWFDRVYQPSREHSREIDSVSIRSLAFLPLIDLSEVEGQATFADGMTDALATELSRVSSLTVESLDSTSMYLGTDKTIRQIARELGVDAVITGSASQKDDQVQIEVVLVDGRTEKEIWAHSYTSPVESSLDLQNEIALVIADKTEAAITP
ncbi:MAG: protein kinase [Deltaproteobacteria bacterium]|nr:protein kinase [Deltaproteobacteria bacterium]